MAAATQSIPVHDHLPARKPPRLATAAVVSPAPAENGNRTSYMENRVFSPVNHQGCFEFDRIVKAGMVQKKMRKTKQYKSAHLVLRPLTVSIYADKEHTALKHNIELSEVTAVARRRRTKRPRPGLFTIFTPPRNFHFDVGSEELADEWVLQIRTTARIDEFESGVGTSEEEDGAEDPIEPAEPVYTSVPTQRRVSVKRTTSDARRRTSGPYGQSVGSFSSISSLGAANFPGSSISLAVPAPQPAASTSAPNTNTALHGDALTRPNPTRSASHNQVEQERVSRNGRLFLLRSKGGVKKWKPVWAVLRPKSLAIYPNDSEYSPILIVPFSSLVNAVEIDSPSRNKKRQFCMQIITEERNWRFCAQDEDDLARWLGTIKSMIAQRKAAEGNNTAPAAAAVGNGLVAAPALSAAVH